MSEWWTYRLSDLLLFAPKTYYRLFALYNRDVWPLHLLTLFAGIVILILALRRGETWPGRVIAATLAIIWLWVGWAFHLERFATINWAATWFAVGFAIEALLLIWMGVIRNHLQTGFVRHPTQWLGLGLFVIALFIEPLLGPLFGRPWIQIELFGIAPDPTVVATLGIIVCLGQRVPASLLIAPVLWCVISGATLWTMRAPDALVLPIAGFLALALALWRRHSASDN